MWWATEGLIEDQHYGYCIPKIEIMPIGLLYVQAGLYIVYKLAEWYKKEIKWPLKSPFGLAFWQKVQLQEDYENWYWVFGS